MPRRFFAPALLFGVTGWVAWRNRDGGIDVVVLVGLDRLVGPDPHAQAQATVWGLALVGLLWSVVALGLWIRDRRE